MNFAHFLKEKNVNDSTTYQQMALASQSYTKNLESHETTVNFPKKTVIFILFLAREN